ncbi:MAG: AmmeMemoRadiSam system protein B [Calditrichaeota bacterium]|nr:MAG: AmmeMemoRadiSam system protein B [Calditrichota bacterium]
MKTRPAAWAGQFYPDDPHELERTVQEYLTLSHLNPHEGKVIGLFVPHAGYIYSGKTAAAGYRQLGGSSYTTVVVMAPSHTAYIDGVSIFDGDFYETPLGLLPVDKSAAAKLAGADKNLKLGEIGHMARGGRAEHALEVQLPFLQMTLTEFQLLPLVFQDFTWTNCQRLGHALASHLDPETTLFVASSDLYHGRSYDACVRSDQVTLASIENDSAEQFCQRAQSGGAMACGAGPITVLKILAELWNAQGPRVIARTNSAKETGEMHDYVVGYAAGIIVQQEKST